MNPAVRNSLLLAFTIALPLLLAGNSGRSFVAHDYEDTPTTDDEAVYEADAIVEAFAGRVKALNISRVTFPDFRRGRLMNFLVEPNGYSVRRERNEDEAVDEVQCAKLVPSSYDFQRCDYTNRRAVMRKRLVVPSDVENDCTVREINVHIDNNFDNAQINLLRHRGINCDCNEGLNKTLQKNFEANFRPSANGRECVGTFAPRRSESAASVSRASPQTYAYVVGCDYDAGKITLLPVPTVGNQSFSSASILKFDSEICQCVPENRQLQAIIQKNCPEKAGNDANSTDDAQVSGACGSNCAMILPKFLKVGSCNFTTGKRLDEAVYLEFDAQTSEVKEERIFVETSHPDCSCHNKVFSTKLDWCEYGQKMALMTTYRGVPANDGSLCEISKETEWARKPECDCKATYRYEAPPVCPIVVNNGIVTHKWRTHSSNRYCTGIPESDQRDDDYAGFDNDIDDDDNSDSGNYIRHHREHPVYNEQLNAQLIASHQNLRSILEELFDLHLNSSCECEAASIRIPIGCTFTHSYANRYMMRFLTLTLHRGTFFCTVKKTVGELRVNPKYCSRK